MENKIQILPSHEIDIHKWNECIDNCSYPLIYANYFFLNAQCENWSGLVIGDYQTVMPLPWKKKWGIRYLYAPSFIQQLGIFGDLELFPLSNILDQISLFVKYGDIFFNHQNKFLLNSIEYKSKTNFVLNLNQPYPDIYLNYHHDLKKNIHKAEKNQLLYSRELSIESAIAEFKELYQHRFPSFNETTFERLTKTCLGLQEKDKCMIRYIHSISSQEPLSVALLLKDKHKIYLLLNATRSAGRNIAANHFLLDQIIKEYSEEEILLDFEGSEQQGIKEFYESFHPQIQPYFHYKFNRLNRFLKWGLKLLKKSE